MTVFERLAGAHIAVSQLGSPRRRLKWSRLLSLEVSHLPTEPRTGCLLAGASSVTQHPQHTGGDRLGAGGGRSGVVPIDVGFGTDVDRDGRGWQPGGAARELGHSGSDLVPVEVTNTGRALMVQVLGAPPILGTLEANPTGAVIDLDQENGSGQV